MIWIVTKNCLKVGNQLHHLKKKYRNVIIYNNFFVKIIIICAKINQTKIILSFWGEARSFYVSISDLASLTLKAKLYLFSDDAVLLYAGSNDDEKASKINANLTKLNEYFQQNSLSLNLSKGKYIHFHGPRKRLRHQRVVLGRSLHGTIYNTLDFTN